MQKKDFFYFILVDIFVLHIIDNSRDILKKFIESTFDDSNYCIIQYSLNSKDINIFQHVNELPLNLHPILDLFHNFSNVLKNVKSEMKKLDNKQKLICIINITYDYKYVKEKDHDKEMDIQNKLREFLEQYMTTKQDIIKNTHSFINLIVQVFNEASTYAMSFKSLSHSPVEFFKKTIFIDKQSFNNVIDEVSSVITTFPISLDKTKDVISESMNTNDKSYVKLNKSVIPDTQEVIKDRQDEPIRINVKSIVKPNNSVFSDTQEERKNEDRFIVKSINNQKKVFGVADGAGGSGIYCGEWAQYLLDNVPDKPFNNCEELNNWSKPLALNFFKDFKNKTNDHIIKTKFCEEGAYSSLLLGWLTCIEENKYQLEIASYGDSTLLLFQNINKIDLKYIYPYKSILDYDKSPNLIPSREDAKEENFKYEQLEIDNTYILIAATDGFARFLFTQYLFYINDRAIEEISDFDKELLTLNKTYLNQIQKTKIRSFESLFKEIEEKISMESEDFQSFVKMQYQKERLANDDCTAIHITFIQNPILFRKFNN